MSETVVTLVKPAPNKELAEALRHALEQAERGEIQGFIMVKLRADQSFAVVKSGDCSNLALSGALAHAQYDLIASNPPKAGK
jgi:hypothetical protein